VNVAVKRILAATDRSETADRAVLWAADMAERYRAELLLLQVVLPPEPKDAVTETDEAFAELRAFADQLAGSRSRARVSIDLDPSRAICAVAEEEGVDVVVVGGVGMSGRREFLLDNVPNRVSHNALCTVVIVNTMGSDRRRVGELLGRSR